MKKVFHIFKIQKEESWLALIIFALLAILNGLVIAKYNAPFTQITNDYYKNFIRHFCVSGFDPLTYWVLSDWSAAYNVYRHPLLAFYMYVPYLINMGLMKLTGYNCALYIAVIIQMFCAFYSMVFLYRIFREVIELGKWASHALTLLFFSFGYVMVSAIVPDHFVISMLLLILALYVSGRRMKNHHDFKIWQSVLYFLLTAGTSLNNGLKIFSLLSSSTASVSSVRSTFYWLSSYQPACSGASATGSTAPTYGLTKWLAKKQRLRKKLPRRTASKSKATC